MLGISSLFNGLQPPWYKAKVSLLDAYNVIKSAFKFPTRYLGSFKKLKSYRFTSKPLRSDKIETYLRTAAIATAIESKNDNFEKDWLKPLKLNIIAPSQINLNKEFLEQNDIEFNDKYFFSKKTGLKVMLVKNQDEIYITFGSAESIKSAFIGDQDVWSSLKNKIMRNNVGNLFGTKPKLYKQAEELFLALKQNSSILENKKLTLVGHCMGGSVASYIGIKHKIKTHGFNTLALGPGLQKELGGENLRQADKYVRHISIKGDKISDFKVVSFVDRFFSALGFCTPGNFGKHYVVPPAKEYANQKFYHWIKKQGQLHVYFFGSMADKLGHSHRAKAKDMFQYGNLL